MKQIFVRGMRCAWLVVAVIVSGPVLAQETRVPAEAHDGASAPATPPAGGAAAAAVEDAEEVIVRGQSRAYLRQQLERAQDKFYSTYNEINSIDDFDIHCRMHADTGSRMPQRICLPNYERRLSARKGQAVLGALNGDAFETDWQQPENEMAEMTQQLQTHMQRLALEHPELLEAMQELHDAMQAAEQPAERRRSRRDADR